MRFEFFDVNVRIGSVPNAIPRHGTTVNELFREMDLVGLAEAVVWHGWANRWDLARGNAELMRALKGHRDRLHPAWVIMHEHTRQMPPGPELVAQLREAGVRLVRLFFDLGVYPGEGASILCHGSVTPALIARYPGANLIIAHGSGVPAAKISPSAKELILGQNMQRLLDNVL